MEPRHSANGTPLPIAVERHFILLDEFRLATGLDGDAVRFLLNRGLLEGGYDSHQELRGFYVTAQLPTRSELLSWGLTPSDDYRPDLFPVAPAG